MFIHIIGGGTFSPVRNHLALAAPAFGETARRLKSLCHDELLKTDSPYPDAPFNPSRPNYPVKLHLTKMADHTSSLVTNDDVANLLSQLVADPKTKIIFLNAALCDFEGQVGDVESGSHADRLKTRDGNEVMNLTPAPKLIGSIRKTRKDIFAVGFKTTTGASPDDQYKTGLNLLKENSLNLVLANDTVTRMNMVIVPEEARYFQTTDRDEALTGLVRMAYMRSQNTFTRSTVVPGESVGWESGIIPTNLKTVVEHCIKRGAYKPFRGVTAGHFAVRVGEGRIVTSKRKHDFNRLRQEGMVLVEYDGTDQVIAHGHKPSVGGQSQRIVFTDHSDADCIVHFHAPLKAGHKDNIPHREQMPYECGSHQCGKNTSDGLQPFGNLKAVMLDEHGPNIVFSRSTPPEEVISFIEANFDLAAKTGGMVG